MNWGRIADLAAVLLGWLVAERAERWWRRRKHPVLSNPGGVPPPPPSCDLCGGPMEGWRMPPWCDTCKDRLRALVVTNPLWGPRPGYETVVLNPTPPAPKAAQATDPVPGQPKVRTRR